MAKQHQDENELFDANDNDASTPTNNNEKGSNAVKDPNEWTTGAEPMTGAQESYLKTLSDQAGEEFDDSLNKADASKKIDELQHKTGRGISDSE
ncbi:DUF3072 domain-containing protein [Mucilaginibacter sp.]